MGYFTHSTLDELHCETIHGVEAFRAFVTHECITARHSHLKSSLSFGECTGRASALFMNFEYDCSALMAVGVGCMPGPARVFVTP